MKMTTEIAKRRITASFLTLVLEALPAPEVLPDLRDGRPLGDGRREDLAQQREGDGVEALEEGPRVVLGPPLLVHRVLGRRVVPRQLCKDGGEGTPLGERANVLR